MICPAMCGNGQKIVGMTITKAHLVTAMRGLRESVIFGRCAVGRGAALRRGCVPPFGAGAGQMPLTIMSAFGSLGAFNFLLYSFSIWAGVDHE